MNNVRSYNRFNGGGHPGLQIDSSTELIVPLFDKYDTKVANPSGIYESARNQNEISDKIIQILGELSPFAKNAFGAENQPEVKATPENINQLLTSGMSMSEVRNVLEEALDINVFGTLFDPIFEAKIKTGRAYNRVKKEQREGEREDYIIQKSSLRFMYVMDSKIPSIFLFEHGDYKGAVHIPIEKEPGSKLDGLAVTITPVEGGDFENKRFVVVTARDFGSVYFIPVDRSGRENETRRYSLQGIREKYENTKVIPAPTLGVLRDGSGVWLGFQNFGNLENDIHVWKSDSRYVGGFNIGSIIGGLK